MWREGDWRCTTCFAHNFSGGMVCVKCTVLKDKNICQPVLKDKNICQRVRASYRPFSSELFWIEGVRDRKCLCVMSCNEGSLAKCVQHAINLMHQVLGQSINDVEFDDIDVPIRIRDKAVSILIAGTRCSAMEGTTSLSIHSPTNSYRPHTQCTAEYLNRPPPGVRVSIWTEKPRSVVRSGPGQNSIRINVAVVAHKGPTFEVS